jgi:hypothetical protein
MVRMFVTRLICFPMCDLKAADASGLAPPLLKSWHRSEGRYTIRFPQEGPNIPIGGTRIDQPDYLTPMPLAVQTHAMRLVGIMPDMTSFANRMVPSRDRRRIISLGWGIGVEPRPTCETRPRAGFWLSLVAGLCGSFPRNGGSRGRSSIWRMWRRWSPAVGRGGGEVRRISVLTSTTTRTRFRVMSRSRTWSDRPCPILARLDAILAELGQVKAELAALMPSAVNGAGSEGADDGRRGAGGPDKGPPGGRL